MNSYYLTLVLKPDLKEEERKEILESITKKFDKLGKEDLWGSRELAYPIKRQSKGYYAHFEFESNPENIKGLDKMVKLNEDIIRYLLIKR